MKSGPGGRNWLDNPFGMPGPNDRASANNWLTSFAPYERLFHTGAAPAAPAGVASSGSGAAFAARFGGGAPAPPPAPVPAKVTVKPELETASLADAKAKAAQAAEGITSALSKVSSKPVKITAPDMSALAAAKGKAAQAAAGITTAMETPLHKPVKAVSPDLSAYAAAKGAAAADGAAISAGLAAGILSQEGAVVAAAAQVAAAATAAMHVTVKARSPSRVTYQTGQDVGTGFEHGIRSTAGKVKAAAKQLSEAAAQSLRTGLLGGQSAIDAVMTALGKGPRPQDIQAIDSAAAKLISEVPKGHSALVKMLKADNADLDRLARQRAVLETEITDAQQITTQAIGNASIMNTTYSPTLAASSGPVSSFQTISGLQAQAGDQAAFAKQIAMLKKMGLNATSLDQLIQGGAQAGLPIALGLTQGGPGAVKQINQLEKSILQSSGKLGDVGGKAMYQAGVDAGNAAAKGLRSQLGTVEAAMRELAGKMVSALESVLGHGTAKKAAASSSGAGGSASSGAGAAGGGSALSVPTLARLAAAGNTAALALARDATAANNAASALNRLASAAGHAAPGGHGGGHGGGGTVVNNYYVTVQGSVTTQQDLLSSLQEMHLTKAANNWQGGWQLPGRAG
jgi:hypothetical protein